MPAVPPTSLWEADSLDGGGFPVRADDKSPFAKQGVDSGDPAPWRQGPPFLAKATHSVTPSLPAVG